MKEKHTQNQVIHLEGMPPQRRRSEVHRHKAEPIVLAPLPGNPNDLTPPFTNDIIRAHASKKE